MSANVFPAGIKTWVDKQNYVDTVLASHMNDAYAEIIAIENFLQDINNSKTTLGIAKGGTGATTATAALNNLLPSQSGQNGKVLKTDGTNAYWGTDNAGSGVNLGNYSLTSITEGSEKAQLSKSGDAIFKVNGTTASIELNSAIIKDGTTFDITVAKDVKINDGFVVKSTGDILLTKTTEATNVAKLGLGGYGAIQDRLKDGSTALATNRRTLILHNAFVSTNGTNTYSQNNNAVGNEKIELGNNQIKLSHRAAGGTTFTDSEWVDKLTISANRIDTANNIYVNNNLVWHAGNDGAGSGLDADKLGGVASSGYSLIGHTHNNATQGTAGYMSAADKLKLDSIDEVTGNYVHPGNHPADFITTNVTGFSSILTSAETNVQLALQKLDIHGHAVATSVNNGFMSAADKAKLDSLGGGYIHPATHAGSMISLDTSSFSNVLSSNESTVQSAMAKLDDHNHDANYLALTGGTLIGALNLNAGNGTALNIQGGGNIVITPQTSGTAVTITNDTGELNVDKEVYVNTKKVWHAGNMIVSNAAPSGGNSGNVWIQYV